MQKKIIITGVLATTLIIGAVGCGNVGKAEAPVATVQAPVVEPIDKPEPIVDPTSDTNYLPPKTVVPDVNGDTEPVHPDNPDWYVVWTKGPVGIYIYKITFHEGFRAPGMKAVDVHIMARSHNYENLLVQGRDEIISITGSTGKVYSMIGTKRTGVNGNASFENFQEQEITQYQDASINEKTITSIVVRRDGKNIVVKPDKDTKFETTHA